MKRPQLAIEPEAQAPEALRRLAANLGITCQLQLDKDVHGRPTVRSGNRVLAYSRSRAGGFCAQALAAAGRVGVDLVDPSAIPSTGFEHLFANAEQAWLRGTSAETTAQAWAVKEAVLKALGFGLGFGLEAIELAPGRGECLRLARIAGLPAEGWHLEISEFRGLMAALVWAP